MELFNEDLKMEFELDYCPSEKHRPNVHKVFKRFTAVEADLGKDLYDFSKQELQDAISNCGAISTVLIQYTIGVLRAYKKWCCDRNLGHHVDIDSLDTDLLEKLREHVFMNPAHLKRILDIIFPNPNEEHVYHLYRAYYWLLYMGLYEDEAARVKENQVNLPDHIIYRDAPFNKTVQIIPEALSDIRAAYTLEGLLETRRTKYGTVAKTMRARAKGSEILRGKYRKDVSSTQSFPDTCRRMTLTRIADVLNEENRNVIVFPTVMYVRRSGIYYRAWRREMASGCVSFEDVIDDDMLHDNHHVSEYNPVSRIRSSGNNVYLKEYIRWKKLLAEESIEER